MLGPELACGVTPSDMLFSFLNALLQQGTLALKGVAPSMQTQTVGLWVPPGCQRSESPILGAACCSPWKTVCRFNWWGIHSRFASKLELSPHVLLGSTDALALTLNNNRDCSQL